MKRQSVRTERAAAGRRRVAGCIGGKRVTRSRIFLRERARLRVVGVGGIGIGLEVAEPTRRMFCARRNAAGRRLSESQRRGYRARRRALFDVDRLASLDAFNQTEVRRRKEPEVVRILTIDALEAPRDHEPDAGAIFPRADYVRATILCRTGCPPPSRESRRCESRRYGSDSYRRRGTPHTRTRPRRSSKRVSTLIGVISSVDTSSLKLPAVAGVQLRTVELLRDSFGVRAKKQYAASQIQFCHPLLLLPESRWRRELSEVLDRQTGHRDWRWPHEGLARACDGPPTSL